MSKIAPQNDDKKFVHFQYLEKKLKLPSLDIILLQMKRLISNGRIDKDGWYIWDKDEIDNLDVEYLRYVAKNVYKK